MSDPAQCRSTRQALWDAHGRGVELTPTTREHLSSCAACAAVARDVARLVRGSRELEGAALSPGREAALWRRLGPALEKIDQRRKRWRWRWPAILVGAAAVSAAMVALVVLPALRPGEAPGSTPDETSQILARLETFAGDVALVSPAESAARAAQTGAVVPVAGQISAGRASRFTLRWGGDRVIGHDLSVLSVEASSRAVRQLRLRAGTVLAEVAHRGPGERFVVRAPRAEVVVVGTLFEVASDATHDTIAVDQGTVAVQVTGGERYLVRAGERLVVSDRNVPARLEPLPPFARAALLRWVEDAAGATAPGAGEVVIAAHTGARADVAARARGGASRRAAPHPADAPSAEIGPDAWQAAIASRDCAAAGRLLEEAQPQAAIDEAATRWMRLAECHFSRQDPQGALHALEVLTSRYPGSPAAENAWYERGRVALQLDRQDDARRSFERYLTLHASGLLAAEAAFRICTIDMNRGRADLALDCLQSLRARYPDSARAVESLFLEATLWRTAKQDCAKAMPAYRRYLEHPGGAYTEQARAWLEWCATPRTRRTTP